MNDVNRNQYDDEIDLFEVVEILWKSKWIIIASVFLSLVIATAYLAYKNTVYLYTVPYSSALNSVGDQSICAIYDNKNLNHQKECLNNYALAKFKDHLNSSFTNFYKKSAIELTSTNGNITEQLQSEIKQAVKKMTTALGTDTKRELMLISADTPTQILGTETVAKNYIAAKRLFNNINDGKKSIVFKPVVKSVKSPKTSLVLALSVIGGGMMGLLLVFMLRMIAAYKKRQVTT